MADDRLPNTVNVNEFRLKPIDDLAHRTSALRAWQRTNLEKLDAKSTPAFFKRRPLFWFAWTVAAKHRDLVSHTRLMPHELHDDGGWTASLWIQVVDDM